MASSTCLAQAIQLVPVGTEELHPHFGGMHLGPLGLQNRCGLG